MLTKNTNKKHKLHLENFNIEREELHRFRAGALATTGIANHEGLKDPIAHYHIHQSYEIEMRKINWNKV